MTPYFDQMGLARLWLERLLPLHVYIEVQFWAGAYVLFASLVMLHVDRRYRWPPAPGRLTIVGYYVGFQILRSGWLSLWLGTVGQVLDIVMNIIGRLGLSLLACGSVFAMEDALTAPTLPRPLATILLSALVLTQSRALTAYTPRLPKQLA